MPWLSPLPVTAREAWQMTALATGPGLRALIAAVPPGGGLLDGRAVLSCRDDGRTLHIGIPRPGSDDAWDIPPGRRKGAGQRRASSPR